jgi:hypothetical protein
MSDDERDMDNMDMDSDVSNLRYLSNHSEVR